VVALNYHGEVDTTPHTYANGNRGVSTTFEVIRVRRFPAGTDISGTCLLPHIKRLTCIMHVSTAEGPQRTGNLISVQELGSSCHTTGSQRLFHPCAFYGRLRSSSQGDPFHNKFVRRCLARVSLPDPSKLPCPEIQLRSLFCVVPRCTLRRFNQLFNTSGSNCG
jgi:hypothetical protein